MSSNGHHIQYDSPEGESSAVSSPALIPTLPSAEISTDSLAIGPVMESVPQSASETVSTVPSVTGDHEEELDPKTPTVTRRGTYLAGETVRDDASHGDAEDEHEGSTEEEEDDEDEDEDEDEDSDEEEEEEPVLKYDRIQKSAAEILEKDSASAIAVGETYFAVGTHNGLVHLFSLSGAVLKSYRPHSASITDITISTSTPGPLPGNTTTSNAIAFLPLPTNLATPSRSASPQRPATGMISDTIATTSLDGQAILHSLATGTTTGHNFRRPLRSIALEPAYSSSQSKSYVCGGLAGDLILTSKSSLSLGGLETMFGLTTNLGLGAVGTGQTQKTLHSGEGPIWTVRWKGDIIAWANDLGVWLYGVAKGEKITFIDRPRDSPRADLFQCTLQWSSPTTLIIGWADLVKIIKVTTRPKVPTEKNASGSIGIAGGALGIGIAPAVGVETVVEIMSALRLDCMVAGVVPWPFAEEGEGHHHSAVEKTLAPVVATTAPIATVAAPSLVAAAKEASSTRPSTPVPTTSSAPPSSSSFLILSYLPTETQMASESAAQQRRQSSNPPELRIVTSTGEEKSSDVLAMKGYERWGCTEYRIVESFPPPASQASVSSGTGSVKGKGKKVHKGLRERDHGGWLVLSPKGVVWVRKRDKRDRVMWLVERERYEEALDEMEKMERDGSFKKGVQSDKEGETMSKEEIGRMYLSHLFKLKQYEKAAKLCPKVLAGNAKAWEDWIFQFAHVEELSVLVPYVPFKTPRLSKVAYGIILVYYLNHDTPALSRTIKEWPSEIYDIPSLINAIPQPPTTVILMECLADLYIKNRQPGKALPYYLRLRRPNVFQLIRDNNLFTDVQEQALLLVEFDQELMAQRDHLAANQPVQAPSTTATSTVTIAPGGVFKAIRTGFAAAIPGRAAPGPAAAPPAALSQSRPGLAPGSTSFWTSGTDIDSPATRKKARGEAIPLLVEYSHSIPIAKVVGQLERSPYYLYLYLDALFDKDPELGADYVERLAGLYAEFAKGRVIRLLQTAQNLQIDLNLERIYKVCERKDMVPEMVWVRSRMGDNKGALFLIIDRLGDVDRAIDFAKERKDDELWDDLLRYSETRPPFIKGLLENVSTEIDPIRIIRRIRNGLEIPGLKESLIKILHDFNLQTSLMEGCGTVLESDCADLANRLQRSQVGGLSSMAAAHCPICGKALLSPDQDLVLVFLCGHMVHAHCTSGGAGLPKQADSSLVGIGLGTGRDIGAKITYAEMIKRRLDHGCPVHQKLEQGDSSSSPIPQLQSHHSHSRHRA